MALNFKLELPSESVLQEGDEQDKIFDLGIIGGGPAGMTAAVYASRKQLEVVMISPDLGGQILWTGGVENYMGYQYIAGPDLAQKFSEQINQFPIKLAQGEKVVMLAENKEQLFTVKTESNRVFTVRSLILATGKRSCELKVPGETEYRGRGVSYCAICDGPFFKNKSVVVVGGGNSGLSAAFDMLELNSQVVVINASPIWQADPILMDRVKTKAELVASHQVKEIIGNGRQVTQVKIVSLESGEERLLKADGVFIEIGLIPNTEAFQGFVEQNSQGEILTNCAARTSHPGVFAAGDCTNVPEKQIIIAAGDGAKAALAAYRYVKNIPA